MLTAILAFFNLVPGLGSVIQKIYSSYNDAKVRITMAKLGVDRDKALELVRAVNVADHESTSRLAIFASSKILLFLLVGFATPLILFEWKVVFVDKVVGPGCLLGYCWVAETDPIKGQVADWATTIIAALFGSGTAYTLAKMYFNKDRGGGDAT